MDLGLKGKVAIVTGSSQGLGRAMALGFAAEGCRVTVCARREEALRGVAEEARERGGEALAVVGDLLQAETVQRVVDQTVATFGRIDILVNNVGGGAGGSLSDTTEEQFRHVVEANLFTTLRFCKAVVPLMKQQGSGAIVNISSIYGKESGGATPYNMAKAGVISLTKQMARELAPFHVRVNTVAPGSILFPGGRWAARKKAEPAAMAEFERRDLLMGWGKPEQVADVVVFLASERASHVSGACWVVDGVQSRSNI